jgi:Flp pilus assembly pilin Flp
MKVALLAGPEAAQVVEEAAPIAEEVEAPVPEKEEMSFEEYDALARKERTVTAMRYGMIGGLIVLALVIIAVIYVHHLRKKGPARPFIEPGK